MDKQEVADYTQRAKEFAEEYRISWEEAKLILQMILDLTF